MSSISVAVIEPVGGHGGADYYDLSLCRALIAAGCRVSLYTCDETNPVDIPGLRFFRVYKRIYGPGNRWLRILRYVRATCATLMKVVYSREGVCHLHVYGGEMRELALIMLLKLCRRKIVITVHDVESFQPASRSGASRVGRFYQLADRLIAHNEITKLELIERFKLSPNAISVIPHGNHIDSVVDMPTSAEARRALKIDQSRKVVLFFGHIKQVKGLDLLIEAIPEVARVIPEATFLIAGRPWKNDFRMYQDLIDNLHIGDHCILHIRFISNSELEHYYAAADVVVLPYRKIYQSGVVIMAMSSRRPVVVSDLPGMTEIVTDGVTGYVFARGSKDALAEQLIRALKDDQGRQEIADRGFAYMCVRHDWGLIGKKTADVYRMALSRGVPLEESECAHGTE